MAAFLRGGEDVVLFSSTDLKTRSGTLYLTNERLHWVEANGDHQETIYFSDIRSTLVSNATSKRVCLKLVTKQDPLGCVFYFTSPNARAELDNFKDTLCKVSKEKGSSRGERTEGGEKREDSQDPTPKASKSPHKSREERPSQPSPPPSSSPVRSSDLDEPPFPSVTNNNSGTNNKLRQSDSNENVSTSGGIQVPSVIVHTGSKSTNHRTNHSPPNFGTIDNYGSSNTSSKQNLRGGFQDSEDDDFFSIKGEDASEGGRDGGMNGWSIEVRDPQKEVESSSKGTYVSYEVLWSRGNQPPQRIRRRYKDFEWLYNHVVGNYQHKTTIPAFPSKSILKTIGSSLPYISSSDDAEFTHKRCQGLDKFMKNFVRSPILVGSRSLQVFLTGGQIDHEPSLGGVAGLLGKVESHLAGTSRRLDDVDIADQNFSDVELDYKLVREMMMGWNLTPKKLPFEKFLVVVLGTTSAGKSAFVNHFFGLQVKRSAVGQMDTHFTVVETLPKEKFAEYSDKASLPKPNFTDEELGRKITGDVYSDPRYGFVFVYLDTFKTLSRYESQFTNYAHYISNYGLVRSIIVNEDYLRGPAEKTQMAKRTILLDSPGFDYTKENEHAMEKFLGNLKILQLFYSMSDLSLFMTPATHINMVSNQIATLELSVLYSLHGAEYVDKLLHEILTTPAASPNGPTNLIPSIVDIKNYVVQKFVHAASSAIGVENKKAEYKGTVVWDKMRFVLTKIDEVFVNQPVGNLHEQFYELGRLLGKHLTYLEAPTFSQCLAIGLPEHQIKDSEPKIGDLKVLMDLIRSLNSESSYMGRLEASVQMMCLELQSAIKTSWSGWISPKQWMSSDANQLSDIYRRSCLRLKKMSISGGGSVHNFSIPSGDEFGFSGGGR